mmetsp:Transcript_18398/g.34229  ORF Transcript_18398/g.34229 Transcript_18398/m.34229 type:complete len:93 (-) Transcript_18398:1773-2051(-)
MTKNEDVVLAKTNNNYTYLFLQKTKYLDQHKIESNLTLKDHDTVLDNSSHSRYSGGSLFVFGRRYAVFLGRCRMLARRQLCNQHQTHANARH